MKKQNVLNLIKYYSEKNDNAFRNEAITIAKYFDNIGDYELSEYIMGLLYKSDTYMPQNINFDSEFLQKIEIKNLEPLYLPFKISEDIKGIINAINHKVGINKFIFEGLPGTGKTEATKNVARLLNRTLYMVKLENIIDSKLGQTNKNIINLFEEINNLPNIDKAIILFDEIDAIAMDRINPNDIREMGRATSTILKEIDKLAGINNDVVIIATTNLFSNFEKALTRRFDAAINFNRYEQKDLIEIAENYFSSFSKKFKDISKDTKLLKKILMLTKKLPYPGELKNLIKTSLAFSDVESEHDYLRRLYISLIGDLDNKDINKIHEEGFTIREIEKLKGKSKSNIARKLSQGELINE